MRKDFAKNAGLAAVILLAPGGFVLGAALVADHFRKRKAAAANPEPVENDQVRPEPGPLP